MFDEWMRRRCTCDCQEGEESLHEGVKTHYGRWQLEEQIAMKTKDAKPMKEDNDEAEDRVRGTWHNW